MAEHNSQGVEIQNGRFATHYRKVEKSVCDIASDYEERNGKSPKEMEEEFPDDFRRENKIGPVLVEYPLRGKEEKKDQL